MYNLKINIFIYVLCTYLLFIFVYRYVSKIAGWKININNDFQKYVNASLYTIHLIFVTS